MARRTYTHIHTQQVKHRGIAWLRLHTSLSLFHSTKAWKNPSPTVMWEVRACVSVSEQVAACVHAFIVSLGHKFTMPLFGLPLSFIHLHTHTYTCRNSSCALSHTASRFLADTNSDKNTPHMFLRFICLWLHSSVCMQSKYAPTHSHCSLKTLS